MNRPDTQRYQRIERLARELRREIELGLHLGELGDEWMDFQFVVLRQDDKPALKGTFSLAPFKVPGAA